MVRHCASIIVLLLLFAESHRNIDWCLYFRILKRDHLRPECNGIYRSRVFKQKDDPLQKSRPLPRELLPSFHRFKLHRESVADLTRKTLGIGSCPTSVSYCRQSLLCHTGFMCYSPMGYCCLSMERMAMANECNLSDPLRCQSKHSYSTCRYDFHCMFAPQRKCCPTLCGYSICI